MRTALHSLSDSLGRRLLFMVKLYAANDCRNDYARDGRRFTVLADEKLSAFLGLERVTGISLG